MEWSERMNAAIGYFEDNLAGEIDFNEAAKLACCSLFHFQRIFMVIIGVTPSEYVRYRRLTLAARDFTATNARVIDVALKYGYDSPEAFTRAFRSVHGINPLAVRKSGVKLTAFPRVSFQTELKGGRDMDYQIIEKQSFDIIGKGRQFSNEPGKSFIELPQFWTEFIKDKSWDALMKFTAGKPGAVTGAASLGICMMEKDMMFYYAIGVEKGSQEAPKGFEIFNIPTATWAVFDSFGPVTPSIQAVIKKIFSQWFPSTGYEHDNISELQVYLPGDMQGPEYHCQVWVPIIKKTRK
jgi:AraC family transcriptional regulator